MDTEQVDQTIEPNPPASDAACRISPHAVFTECPQCAGPMRPEHAHFRCGQCGWRDSCCD